MDSEYVSIDKKCTKCGSDLWYIKDEVRLYKMICMKCYESICIDKQTDFTNNFECPQCGSLSGELEENDEKLGVRCNNCGKLHIMLIKHTTDNTRHEVPTQQIQPKCPTCSSTNIEKISTSKKVGGIIGFGIFSKTARSQFRCKDCGYKW